MSVDVEGYIRIRREEIWWIWLSTMISMILWATWQHTILIDTIPLCQKACHQRDSCRRHYQSQKQRQIPYPLQAMILYCQCQCHLHLLFHKERVFHQKPWCYEDGYIIVCGCEWSEEIWSWSSTNRSSKHKKYIHNNNKLTSISLLLLRRAARATPR